MWGAKRVRFDPIKKQKKLPGCRIKSGMTRLWPLPVSGIADAVPRAARRRACAQAIRAIAAKSGIAALAKPSHCSEPSAIRPRWIFRRTAP